MITFTSKRKKGQIGLADAPYAVFIVGFVFLLMATIAYIGQAYQEGFSADVDVIVRNETLTAFNETQQCVDSAGKCNFKSFVILYIGNESGEVVIPSSNYTANSSNIGCVSMSSTGGAAETLNNTIANISYSFSHTGTACNITISLNNELVDNTSIAGIVLTISLIGIVLSILIGIFVASRRNQI